METTVEKQVLEMVAEQLGIPEAELTLDKAFIADLNADSLDLTEFVMTLEEKFGFEVSEQEAEKLKKLSDVVEFIHKKRAAPKT